MRIALALVHVYNVIYYYKTYVYVCVRVCCGRVRLCVLARSQNNRCRSFDVPRSEPRTSSIIYYDWCMWFEGRNSSPPPPPLSRLVCCTWLYVYVILSFTHSARWLPSCVVFIEFWISSTLYLNYNNIILSRHECRHNSSDSTA